MPALLAEQIQSSEMIDSVFDQIADRSLFTDVGDKVNRFHFGARPSRHRMRAFFFDRLLRS
jgi:hypothetical protein